MLKFTINEHFELRLENSQTNIYVNNELFIQCKYLLLNLTLEELENLKGIRSIDEVVEKLYRSHEFSDDIKMKISPEVQFWGHCSNLQVWYENNYNSCLIHSNLAFPLLKKLTEAGDIIAKKIFKEEIAKRFENGHLGNIQFLLYNNYLNFLNSVEIECLFEQSSPKLIEIILIQLKPLLDSILTNYRKIKELIDLILFIDLKFNRTLIFNLLKRVPQKYQEQFGKFILLHLNFKEFNEYKIPYGKFYYYFEHFISYLYEHYPYFSEFLKFVDSGYYGSSYSLEERFAYGTVSYE
ncbi:MAG: hypothetical protein ACFFA0_15430 [Promethearchaeota archaeon]